MSNTIDTRIVEMMFDSKQFGSGVKDSLQSIEQLKKGLEFDKVTGSLDEISKKLGSLSFSAVESGINAISNRFSLLGDIAFNAIDRIANSVVDLGHKMLTSMTIDPAKSGLEEYTTQIDAIQTILSNTRDQGTTLEDVTSVLEDLNHYADKTIYNFTQMTANMGKFTTSGLGLEQSRDAIKGIANLAAVSGSSAEQASHAMYQLSQAMASGTVRAQDWMSVVNAGMGGKIFQDSLVETASRLGTMVEYTETTINKAGKKVSKAKKVALADFLKDHSFKESLAKGWLTDDILSETLQKFAGDKTFEEWTALGYTPDQARAIIELGKDAQDAATKVKTLKQLISTLAEAMQSGWTKSWELIFGNFDEAKELFTSISDYFGARIEESANKRNELLKEWKELGGRQAIIDGFWNLVKSVEAVKKAIKGVFLEFFPAATSNTLVRISEKFRDFTRNIFEFVGDFEKMSKVRDIFRGIAAGLDFFRSVIVATFNGIKKGLTGTNIGNTLLDMFSKLGQKITELVLKFKSGDSLDFITDGVAKAVEKLVSAFRKVVNFFKGSNEPGGEVSEFSKVIAKASEILTGAKDGVAKVAEFFSKSDLISNIRNFFLEIASCFSLLTNQSGKIDIKGSILDTFTKLGEKIREFVSKFRSGSGGGGSPFKAVSEEIVESSNSIRDAFSKILSLFTGGKNIGEVIGGFIEDLKKSAASLTGLKIDLSKVTDFFKNGDIFTGVKEFFGQLGPAFQSILNAGSKIDLSKVLLTVLGGTAFGSVIKLISDFRKGIDTAKEGVQSVTQTITDTIGNAVTETKKKEPGFKNFALSVLEIAVAIGIVAAAFYFIAKLDTEKMAYAGIVLGGITAALLLMTVFLSKMKFSKASKFLAAAAGLILISAAISVVASALIKIAQLSPEQMLVGAAGLGAALLEVAGFMLILSKTKVDTVKTFAILMGIKKLAKALEIFASIDTDSMISGLVGMGVAMLELALFLKLLKGVDFGAMKAVGIFVLALAIKEFAKTVVTFAGIDTDTLISGLIGMGAVMLEIGVFLRLAGNTNFGILKSAGLFLFTYTLGRFISEMEEIVKMDDKDIIRGIVGMGAILLEIGVFLRLANGLKIGSAVALAIIAPVLNSFVKTVKKIGDIDTDKLVKGIIGLGAVLIELGLFTKLANSGSLSISGSFSLVLVALSAIAFASAIKKIGSFDTEVILKGVIGLGLVLAEVAVFTRIAKGVNIGTGVSLVAVAVSMLVFGEAISRIGSIDFVTILKGVIGLGLVLAEVALFTKSIKAINLKVSAMVGIIALALGMKIMADALTVVSKIDVVSAATAVGALGIVMAEMSAFLKATSSTSWGGIAKILISAVVMLGMMVAFAEVVKSLNNVNVDTMVGFAASFGGSLLAVVGSLAILNAIPFSGILIGIVKLGVIIAALIGVMALLGAAEDEWNVSHYVESFGNILEAIGVAFGRLFSGFGTGLFVGFADIGSQLSGFMTNAQPFIDGVKKVDEGVLTGVKNLTGALVEIAGANITESLAQWLTGRSSVETFVSDITQLGQGLAAYAKSVEGISGGEGSGLDESVKIATSLNELTKALPDTGGLVQWIAGAKDLGGFAEDIPTLGSALKSYSESVSGISPDDGSIGAALTAAEGLVGLLEKIPAEGGWVQGITGVSSLSNISDDIPGLGAALKAYVADIDGIGQFSGDASSAIGITEGLVGLLDKIPAEGGWIQGITGVPTLGSVAGDIPALGAALKAYVTDIDGISNFSGDATNAQAIAEGLVGLIDKIPPEGGLVQKITGVSSLSSVADDLPDLGKALRAYGENITGLTDNSTDSQVAQSIMEGLVGLVKKVPASGGWVQKITGVKSIGEFSQENFEQVGKALKAYKDNIAGIEGSVGDSKVAQSIAEGLVGLVEKVPAKGGWLDKINGVKDLGSFAENDITKLGDALKEYTTAIKGLEKVDDSDIKAAIDITTGLTGLLDALPETGGLVQAFLGVKSLGSLAKDMPNFGESLKAYAENLSGFTKTVTTEDTTNAIAVANGIASLTKELPPTGGWLQTITGYSDLQGFSSNVKELGAGLKSFAQDVGGIDKGQSEVALSVMSMIRDFATGLDNTGGVMQAIESFFSGNQDPVGLTKQMAEMGVNLASFANNVSGVDTGNTEKATKVMGMIQEFVGSMTKEGGIIGLLDSAINGGNDIESFSNKVAAFGNNFKIFADGIGDAAVAQYDFKAVTNLMEDMKTFALEAEQYGKAFNNVEFYNAGEMLKSFGNALHDFGNNIAGTNSEQLAYAAVAIDHLVDIANKAAGIDGSGVDKIVMIFQDYANAGIGSMIDALLNSQTETADAAGVVADGLENAKGDYNDAGSANGDEYVRGLQNAVKSATAEVKESVTVVTSAAVTAARGSYAEWVDVGAYLCKGLARGITEESDFVKKAVKAVMKSAISTAKSVADLHSPSKVFEEIGKFIDLGWAIGINKYSGKVESSTEDVANQSINSAKTVLSRFSMSLSEGMDTTPVIRPVVDLSGARDGADAINGMFSSDRSLRSGIFAGRTFANNARSVSIDNARISGNGGQDVVGAINTLNERFDNLSNAVKNMQIVTETGVLVGAISEKMDRSLGIMAGRRNRGN